ncbi:MAG: TonB-dependent receptor, partial [Bacteroidetes bacterium]
MRILTLITTLLISSLAFAQTEISGKIIDKTSSQTLAGVNIKLKNKFVGTVSNVNGEFRLITSESLPFEIEISMIGYESQSLMIERSISNLNITLSEQVLFGDEVVIAASRIEENI